MVTFTVISLYTHHSLSLSIFLTICVHILVHKSIIYYICFSKSLITALSAFQETSVVEIPNDKGGINITERSYPRNGLTLAKHKAYADNEGEIRAIRYKLLMTEFFICRREPP